MAVLLLLTAGIALAEDTEDTQMNVKATVYYHYNDFSTDKLPIEKMLDRINELRLPENAWYWNEQDTEKVYLTDLAPLTYDYGLEEVAMQRAAECAVFYSHTRPNGTIWHTAYPKKTGFRGENISAGQLTIENVFKAWAEEDKKYNGQGHRRNMLSTNFTHVGVGCVQAGRHLFWVQAFASYNSDTTERVKKSGPADIVLSVSILNQGGLTDAALVSRNFTINEGETSNVPAIQGKTGYWKDSVITIIDPNWKSGDETIASIKDGKLTANKGGKTTLTVSDLKLNVNDELISQDIVVNLHSFCKEHTPFKSIVSPTQEAAGSQQEMCSVCELALGDKLDIPALKDMHVLTIPAKAETIDEESFTGIAADAVILPDTVKAINSKAFAGSSKLMYVQLPEGVTVAEDAFENCAETVVMDYRKSE